MKRIWQIGNIVSLLFALIANYLVGAQVLNLPSIGEMSDKYATLLTPASYAFSIWSLIYILLIVFVIYQARDIRSPQKENTLPQKVGPFFIIASICNGLWTYLFVSDLVGLSVIALVTLTVSLYVILYRLRIALDAVSMLIHACVWWPLLLYTGWVTVATVVNVASWVTSMGVTVSVAAAGITLVSLAIGLSILLLRRNTRELLLACAWGIAAIGVEQLRSPEGSQFVAMLSFSVTGYLVVISALHAIIMFRAKQARRTV